jgi:hypothetical protein
MIALWRKSVLVLLMLWLPLQGAMAANMSLCLKDKDINVARVVTPDTPETPETPLASASVSAVRGMTPCAAEQAMIADSGTSDIPHADQHSRTAKEFTQGIANTDEVAFTLKCDGVPCQASCTAPIPSAASTATLGDRFSYGVLFNSRFSLLVLEQLQRPPLA